MSEDFVRKLREVSSIPLTSKQANDLTQVFFETLIKTVIASNKTVTFKDNLSFKKTLMKERAFRMPDNSLVQKPAHYVMTMSVLGQAKKLFDNTTVTGESRPMKKPSDKTANRKDSHKVHKLIKPVYDYENEFYGPLSQKPRASLKYPGSKPNRTQAKKAARSSDSSTTFNDYSNETMSKKSGISSYFGDKSNVKKKKTISYKS